MIDIVPEIVNRIRLNNDDLLLLNRLLLKIELKDLNDSEVAFHKILSKRVKGRLEYLKENGK